MPVTADQVMEKYIETRDLIATKTKAFSESIADLKSLQATRDKWLLGQLNTQDVESIKAKHGTCFIKWQESVTVADPDVFMDWVHADWDDRKHFLENRCSKGAVKQRLEDSESVPPGVKHTKVKTVQVRRP